MPTTSEYRQRRFDTSVEAVPDRIGVLLFDPRPMRREATGAMLAATLGLRVVGGSGEFDEMHRQVRDLRPDVVVLDAGDEQPFIDSIARLVEGCGARVVLVGRSSGGPAVRRALGCGIAAYVLGSTASADELLQAIRAAAAGRSYVDPAVGARLAFADEGDVLTDREREVVRLLTLGYRNAEVAARLFVSVRTVESHRTNAMAKLRLQSRWQLVRWALDMGLIGRRDRSAARSRRQ